MKWLDIILSNDMHNYIKLTVAWVLVTVIGALNASAQKLPDQYREKFAESFPIRKEQHLELKAYTDKILSQGIVKTMTSFNPDFFSVEDYENSLYPSLFFLS